MDNIENMDNNENTGNISLSSILLNDNTKNACMFLFVAIFIVFLFVISPLKNFIFTSVVMRLIAILMLIYTIYLNIILTNSLRVATTLDTAQNVKSQLNTNIMLSYILIFLMAVSVLFILKSFF